MAVLLSSLRLFTPAQIAIYRRIPRLCSSVQRSYTSDTSSSSADRSSSVLERYKDAQKYFRRRLEATYHRFSNTADHTVIHGHHHVYVIENDGIYRFNNQQSEQVLDLGEVTGGEEETGFQNEERLHWSLQRVRLSPKEKHLAATLKCSRSEKLRCVVVRLEEKHLLPLGSRHIRLTLDKVFTFEWASDDVLFYTALEDLRSSAVFRLELTSGGSRITCVYEETSPDVFVEVSLSRDRQILTISCNSRTSSEVLISRLSTPRVEPAVVQPRQQGLLYHVEHWKGQLIILANTGPGQEYQVVTAPLSGTSLPSWVSLFSPDPGTVIRDMDVVGDHCVLVARTPLSQLVLIVVPLTDGKEAYTVQLPSWACAIEIQKPGLADQQETLEFLISSPARPPAAYRLHPDGGLLLSGGGDGSSSRSPAEFFTTRLEACSPDGTLVPITLLHAEPVEGLSQAPLLVSVYGAYGRDLNMDFSPEARLLLEQGWALAYCHVRGGGERGLSWHRQARVEGKQKGVEDLRSCLLHLFSAGVSAPSLTALSACSAGAVPVGALCNRQPGLLQSVALQAPFLDVLGTMEDRSLPLTLEDADEWGDPEKSPEHRSIIASYCPLQNITPQRYPSMLLTAYSGDARVPLAGVLKYTQLLKKAVHTHTSTNPECEPAPSIVLNIQPGANHHGPEDFEQLLEEEALKLAFLYTELGLDLPRPSRKRRRSLNTNRRSS
ncbi:prolyl endopeptidase-like [Salarias fasciatus]|uniref:prolyl endopeptidase-like n=1 Tax=Salarias fasciatus TaxID=181472 RepID=UPI001176693B|nr:prolyl endopeptidase-like [Salarias fasciatus]